MVQTEPNLTLTLEALGASGAVLSTEVKAALAHSLPLKKAELAVRSLSVWGRITARNGKDYIVAQAAAPAIVKNGKVCSSVLYFYTQDGLTWSDLPKASDGQVEVARHMREMLTGDIQHKFFHPPKPEGEEEEDAGAEGEEGKPKVHRQELTELYRLRAMLDDIAAATQLVPLGSQVIDADNKVVSNPLFAGLDYPDKLESFYHEHHGPKGPSAAEDVRGSWALQYDQFKQVTVCRNLMYIGYCFFYNRSNSTWGGFYHGDGLKNNDLIFML